MEKLTIEYINLIQEPPIIDDLFCYSGYFINITKDELSEWLGREFTKSSDIKSLKRKQTKQYFLNSLKKTTDGLKKWIPSFQYFVNTKNQYFYSLSDEQVNIIVKYVRKDSRIIKEFNFSLDYWKDLYFNDNFTNCYMLEKNDKFRHFQFTETKYEERNQFPVDLFLETNTKWKADFFILTKDNKNSKIMEKHILLAPFVELEKADTMFDRLKATFAQIKLLEKLKLLTKLWEELDKNPDLFIFGNDILKSIKNYEVKEVYCFEEFYNKIKSNMDNELLNFKWTIFSKKNINYYSELSKLNDYKGIVAKRYFVA